MAKEYNHKGYIHSTESFGTVDGPGVRFVVFFQGCPMRCLYCHNPDTWKTGEGKELTAEEILEAYKKNEVFYKNGGITATGGEPLMQLDFLTELFRRQKNRASIPVWTPQGSCTAKSGRKSLYSSLRFLTWCFWILSTAMKQVIKTLQVLDRSMCWNLPAFWKKKDSNDRPPCDGSGDHR